MTFQEFLNKWTNPAGQRIDYDHVYAYQCVDLPLEYIYECYGITSAYGNAIDWWTNTSANLLPKFSRIATNDTQAGDIVVLNGLPGNPYGHIGLATGKQNDTQFELMEQNGNTGNGSGLGGDAIRTRWVNRSRVAGVLRPISLITLDQLNYLYSLLLNRSPDPAGIDHYVGHYSYDFVSNDLQNSNEYKILHAPATTPLYEVVETYPNGKQIKLNKQPTCLWGMNYKFDYMVNHPVETHNVDEIWTVTNKVHHQDGYYYYRRADQVDGFNVLDCDDYVPPQPEPAAPVVVPEPATTPPAAPLTVPTSTEKYYIKTQIFKYAYMSDAAAKASPTGTLDKGNAYYKFKELNGMFNLTTTPGEAQPIWINPADNVEVVNKPVVHPDEVSNDWQKTLVTFPKPVIYKVVEELTIFDVAGTNSKQLVLTKNEEIPMIGYFVRNNIMYLLCRLASDTHKKEFYGVPTDDYLTGSPNLINAAYHDTSVKPVKAVVAGSAEARIQSYQQIIGRAVNDGVRFIDGIIPVKKLKAWFKDKT